MRAPLCWLVGVAFLTPAALQAQAPPAPPADDTARRLSELESLEDLLAFIEDWEGDPDELQRAYDQLSPEQRALIDQNFEAWSLEGGLGLMGGLEAPLGEGGEGRGLFRLSVSVGVAWPVGDYALPIYYAATEIPGPWAVGFQVFGQADNFDTFSGGASLRLAWEYIGTTPFVELGPAFRAGAGVDAAPGAHLELGYGNILLQGFVQAETWFSGDLPLTVLAGIRLPWLLFTLL
jgi:hypothetical protein